MMVGIRVTVFIELSDILELFLAHCAVERPKGFRDLGLDFRSASDVVLSVGECANPAPERAE